MKLETYLNINTMENLNFNATFNVVQKRTKHIMNFNFNLIINIYEPADSNS